MDQYIEKPVSSTEVIESMRFKIIELLRKYNTPLESWGVGEAKTLDNLIQEVLNGETELVETENGELVRQIIAVDVQVRYVDKNNNITSILREVRQEFADGRKRQREGMGSLAEKVKVGEDPKQAALRGMKEELGIANELPIEFLKTENKNKDSKSFPGLNTKYVIHFFTVNLTDRQYKSEGYIEVQADKKRILSGS